MEINIFSFLVPLMTACIELEFTIAQLMVCFYVKIGFCQRESKNS